MVCAFAIGGCAASADHGGSGGAAGFGGTGAISGTGGLGGSAGTGGLGGSSGWGGVGGVGGTAGTGGTGGTSGTGGSGGEPRQPIVIDDCVSATGVTAEQIAMLKAGGETTGLRFLYPYDGTVFPRGLKSPELMWESALATVAYVRIQASLLDYQGCFFLTQDGRVQLPQHVWDAAGQQTLGPNDPFTISLSTLHADRVRGPIQEQIVIAQATLKGSIYYNSYSSTLAPNGGAVLRIPPGGNAELFVGSTQCVGCHSVSANGTRLIADAENYGAPPPPPPPFLGGFGFGGGADAGVDAGTTGPAVFAITPTTQPNPAPVRQPALYVSFAALSPDGSVYISNAPNYITTVSESPPYAMLVETDTGTEIPNHSIPAGATMPSFSPDGTRIVFTDMLVGPPNPLIMMDYDATLRRASNMVVLSQESASRGWPFVLPDNRAVIYTRSFGDPSYSGSSSGYYQGITELTALEPNMRTELYMVDVESKRQIRLDRAMGYDPSQPTIDATYLPFGTSELGRAYYPTVSPVAAGGYFWVFFDSVRHYGMLGPQRQLWGTAISISPDGTYDTDRSHPAFYLPGQEFGTGNHRAFTALDPCRNDGTACDTGIDCCSGFCINNMCGTPEVPRCAETNEACADSSDCCSTFQRCFAGFCGEILPD